MLGYTSERIASLNIAVSVAQPEHGRDRPSGVSHPCVDRCADSFGVRGFTRRWATYNPTRTRFAIPPEVITCPECTAFRFQPLAPGQKLSWVREYGSERTIISNC